jgi:hypothetical protein
VTVKTDANEPTPPDVQEIVAACVNRVHRLTVRQVQRDLLREFGKDAVKLSNEVIYPNREY